MRGATLAMTSFSAENVLRQRLVTIGVTADLFAVLADMSQSRLSRAMRGLQPFSGEESHRYLKLSEDLQQLANTIQPFSIALDPNTIQRLLDDFRAHKDQEHWQQLESALTVLRGRVAKEEE